MELAQVCREVGLPPGVLNILTGLGHEAGAPLASHPHVDKVPFSYFFHWKLNEVESSSYSTNLVSVKYCFSYLAVMAKI